MPFGIRMRWKIKSTKSGCLCNRDTNWIIQGPIRCIFCSSIYQGMCGINTKDYACTMPPVWWDWLKFGITDIVTEVWTSKPGWHSLQNKIWNLADWSTILRKFIYDFKRRKACRTDPNFAGQGPRFGTYFEDWWRTSGSSQPLVQSDKFSRKISEEPWDYLLCHIGLSSVMLSGLQSVDGFKILLRSPRANE